MHGRANFVSGTRLTLCRILIVQRLMRGESKRVTVRFRHNELDVRIFLTA
ncbi:protein of unknown function [Bradyrhizobium vignae]|uniref:Uncharacterized protein n=1 Tax=Bradyrhizobium vignae TaxID=1549949 RepID=A0A2U3Q885_9BRAD|nr:protein of unknown function [Bradyrhizobium vignae]